LLLIVLFMALGVRLAATSFRCASLDLKLFMSF
jgi:hypothetical protein